MNEKVPVQYKKTLGYLRQGMKAARREIENDKFLSQVLEAFLQLEEILNNGTERSN